MLRADLAAARQENTLLRQKIDALVRRVFGASSERLDPGPLELLLAQSATAPAPPVEPAAPPAVPRAPRPRAERTRVCPPICRWSRK